MSTPIPANLAQIEFKPGELAPPRAAQCRCMLRVYRTFDSVEFLRREWDELGAAINADLFGSFDWCATWWKHFSKGRRLEIHAAWAGNELVALFPLFRETLWWGPIRLRVVRVLGTDHAGTRCWPMFKTQYAEEVANLIMAELTRSGPWDLIHIGDLPGYFEQTDVLAEAFRAAGNRSKVYVNRNYYPHGVFTIPDDFEKYLAQLSGNERNNIRKNERRLAKTHQLRSTVVRAGESKAFLEEFFKWHDDHWDAQNELGFFTLWPGSRKFHREIAQVECDAGKSILLRVTANDEPVGHVCAHRFYRRLHLFQAVRAPGSQWESYGPGRLLHCEVFRLCMAEGISTVDAMSGYYEYKRRLGAEFLGLTTIAVAGSAASTRLRTALFRAVTWIADWLYFRLWLSKAVPQLRKRLRASKHPALQSGMSQRFIRSRFILAVLRGTLVGAPQQRPPEPV